MKKQPVDARKAAVNDKENGKWEEGLIARTNQLVLL